MSCALKLFTARERGEEMSLHFRYQAKGFQNKTFRAPNFTVQYYFPEHRTTYISNLNAVVIIYFQQCFVFNFIACLLAARFPVVYGLFIKFLLSPIIFRPMPSKSRVQASTSHAYAQTHFISSWRMGNSKNNEKNQQWIFEKTTIGTCIFFPFYY